MIWAIVPAAGRGARFGGDVPKQYLEIAGVPLIGYSLRAVLAHPSVAGAMVVLSEDDALWPGWTHVDGKPVQTCIGGAKRCDSVLAGRIGHRPLLVEGSDDNLKVTTPADLPLAEFLLRHARERRLPEPSP